MADYRTSRARPSRAYTKERKQELADRVIGFYERDLQDRSAETDMRLQRYAKLRGWTEPKDFPWPDASNVALADIQTANLRVQDTLHNAVMSGSPVIAAKALSTQDGPKEEYVDSVIDHQVFNEQPGEIVISTLGQQFVEDGQFTCLVSWIKEDRRATEVRKFDPIPEGALPPALFQGALQKLPNIANARPKDADAWDWELNFKDGTTAKASFYFEDGDESTALHITRDMSVFNGPKLDPIAWDDLFYPPRCENLQIPGPSNKGGAGHVGIRSFPTVDEIERLVDSGFYDQVDKEAMEAIRLGRRSLDSDEEAKQQKDALAGKSVMPQEIPAGTPKATDDKLDGGEAHRNLTRLMCFDIFDIDGDGVAEDIVCWVIKESATLLKCMPLSEYVPFSPPRRPLARAQYLPVEGSADGIGLPELMEGYHDFVKMLLDQTVDIGTITGVPFGFYRASGGNRPEVIKFAPGEMYPLADPQKDVNFPRMNNQGNAMGLNMVTWGQAQQEKLTNIGDLQLGRVPVGRASALRTVGGMSMVAQQGEARPERILRRFFIGLADIWSMIHQLNQVFMPKSKMVRLRSVKSKDQLPYKEVRGEDVRMQAIFEFKANAYNASLASKQEGMNACAAMWINPVALQAGVIDPDGIYRFMRDYGTIHGQDSDQYLKPPSPDAMKQKLLAEEVIFAIHENQGAPDCAPLEPGGAQEHYQKLMAFTQSQQIGLWSEDQIAQLRAYLHLVLQRVKVEQQQAAMAEAMSNFNQARQQPGQGGGAVSPQTQADAVAGPAPISGPNELTDETMPGAGGGANPGMAA